VSPRELLNLSHEGGNAQRQRDDVVEDGAGGAVQARGPPPAGRAVRLQQSQSPVATLLAKPTTAEATVESQLQKPWQLALESRASALSQPSL
jgi:hypothetical protein